MYPARALFPQIPLFDTVCGLLADAAGPLDDTALVCVQHLLETTGSLFERLIALGVPPASIFVLGKPYSTSREVAERLQALGIHVLANEPIKRWGELGEHLRADVGRLWNQALERLGPHCRRIVVLDDGGYAAAQAPARQNLPYRIVGVEQTTSGVPRGPALAPPFPVVEVASSAVKKYLESKMIETAVLRRIEVDANNHRNEVCGVIGLGNIGKALACRLLEMGRQVVAYDKDDSKMRAVPASSRCGSIREVFEKASWIFGCTGNDFLAKQPWWKELRERRVLVSCSSADIEFRTALRTLKQTPRDALCDIDVPTRHSEMRILRGGCPANFDRSVESVPAVDIQLTRALLLGGVLQAAAIARLDGKQQGASRIMLSPEMQAAVAREWLQLTGANGVYDSRAVEIVQSAGLAAVYSGGKRIPASPFKLLASLTARRPLLS